MMDFIRYFPTVAGLLIATAAVAVYAAIRAGGRGPGDRK
jgi:hypothetical protein